MNDLDENEVLIDDEHYASAPNQCSLCESWQVDMVLTVPSDRTKLGDQLRAAGWAMVNGMEMTKLFLRHLRDAHPDLPGVQGFMAGMEKSTKEDGSPSD